MLLHPIAALHCTLPFSKPPQKYEYFSVSHSFQFEIGHQRKTFMSRMAPLLDPKLPPIVMSSPNLVPRFPISLTSCNLLHAEIIWDHAVTFGACCTVQHTVSQRTTCTLRCSWISKTGGIYLKISSSLKFESEGSLPELIVCEMVSVLYFSAPKWKHCLQGKVHVMMQ